MNLHIETESADRGLVSHVMGSRSIAVGQETLLTDGVSIQYNGSVIQKQFGVAEIAEFIVTFSSGVAASLVASALYEKFRGRTHRIRIDRMEVRLDKGEIERVIVERIEKS